jgi:hypothetical protein
MANGRVRGAGLFQLGGAEGVELAGPGDLAADVGHHRKHGNPGDHVFRFPEPRLVAELLKLLGPAAALLDVSVDALGEGAGDVIGIGRVGGPLGFPITAEAEEECGPVAFEIGRAEHFGELSGPGAAPKINLPQAVDGGHVALGEVEVILILGVDVGDAPLVPQDFDRRAQSGDAQLLAVEREREE